MAYNKTNSLAPSQVRRTRPLKLLAGLLVGSVSICAQAQQAETTTTETETANKTAEYEVITVTSQRRAQKLSEVPIALTSFSADNIQQSGISELREIADFIPNMDFSRGTDFGSQVTIRGVGANSRNIGFDTRVGVYLDGVYLGQSPALNQALYDLARVEVLRGPQGTLFGKNTVAGAINLISARPDDTLAGYISGSFGNLSARELQGRINIPLSVDSALKLSASHNTRDGYIDNLATGNKANERDTSAYRAQFSTVLNDNWQLYASLDGLNSERLSFLGKGLTDPFGLTAAQGPADNYEIATNSDTFEKRDLLGGSIEMVYEKADYEFKSITAWRDSEIFYRNDTDYSVIDFLTIEYGDQYQQFSQEFQLVSPATDTFNYVAGVYLYRQQAKAQRDAINGAMSVAVGNVPGTKVSSDGHVDTDSYALFGNTSYQLTERFNLATGLRYSRETKTVNWLLDGSASGIFRIGSTTPALNDKRTDNDLSYSVSLIATLNSNLNGYLKYATGFKSGGYNLDFVSDADLAASLEFDKEQVGSAELGLKGAFYNNRLIANFAMFHSSFDDYQVNQFVDLGNGSTSISIRNAAEVTTKGMELELIYRPLAGLQLQVSAGVLNAKFEDFPNGLSNGVNAAGNQLPDAPKRNAALSAQYVLAMPLLNADLLLRGDVTYKGDFYTTVANSRTHTLSTGGTVPFGYVESQTLANARIGLQGYSGWEAYLWVRNLTDDDSAISSSRDFLGTIVQNYQEPRTFGIELIYSF